jgi:hypothetical protein
MKTSSLVRLIAFTVATFLASTVFAQTKYYIDYVGGVDTNSGTTKAAAWQHAPQMKGCSGNCSSHAVLPSDQFIFKGGVVWPSAVMPWLWTSGRTNIPNPTGYRGVYLGYDPTWNTGQVLSIRPTSSGYKCTSLNVVISGGGGAGAAGTANFMTSGYLAGLLQHVTLTNPGAGYTSNPTVTFTGSCTTMPTAVADIYSPIWDASGTIWNESNGVSPGYGPINFAFVNYLTIDHIEIRGARFDHTIAPGSSIMYMLNQQGGDHTTWQNIYVHSFGPDVINLTGTYSFNGTGGFQMNIGYSNLNTTVTNSYFDNFENEVFAPCGFSNNSPANYPPPCGSSYGANGATVFTNNVVHDIRGMVYAPSVDQNLDYHGNMMWNSVWDCCQQHEDAFYFFGGGVVYNNVLHDLAQGAAAFYIELSDGVGNCNQTYLFNNVIWNVGQSTPPIGHTAEFYNQPCNGNNLVTTPIMNDYNNTLYALNGTSSCINWGQQHSQSAAVFNLYNNHCISNQSAGGGTHWYGSNGTSYGTINGLGNPNSTATQTVVDAANTITSPAAATLQGYTAANNFAPGSATAATVLAAPKTFPCSLSTTALCADITGATRVGSGSNLWQMGAYKYGPNPPTALTVTVN